jgi:patatin-like phospholipase/acyl hydrolase
MTFTSAETKHVRVLSIDGGGIRGIVPAVLLAEIERRTNKPVCDLFDLAAGTSTGGILVLALVRPNENGNRPAYGALEVVDFYQRLGPAIFSKPLAHQVASVGGFLRSRYPDTQIEAVLNEFFGNTRLRDALVPVLVPSYELERRTPFFFRSSMARLRADYDFPMHTVARSTSAAPTYFPPEQVPVLGTNDSYVLIDGGVFANNPAACAFVEAKTQFPSATNFTVVSLGTGAVKETPLMTKASNWGIAQWARPILDTVLDGVSSTVDYQLSQLLPPCANGTERYFRLQTELPGANAAMDNASQKNLEQLKAIADKTIEERSDDIDRICHQLT